MSAAQFVKSPTVGATLRRLALPVLGTAIALAGVAIVSSSWTTWLAVPDQPPGAMPPMSVQWPRLMEKPTSVFS